MQGSFLNEKLLLDATVWVMLWRFVVNWKKIPVGLFTVHDNDKIYLRLMLCRSVSFFSFLLIIRNDTNRKLKTAENEHLNANLWSLDVFTALMMISIKTRTNKKLKNNEKILQICFQKLINLSVRIPSGSSQAS